MNEFVRNEQLNEKCGTNKQDDIFTIIQYVKKKDIYSIFVTFMEYFDHLDLNCNICNECFYNKIISSKKKNATCLQFDECMFTNLKQIDNLILVPDLFKIVTEYCGSYGTTLNIMNTHCTFNNLKELNKLFEYFCGIARNINGGYSAIDIRFYQQYKTLISS